MNFITDLFASISNFMIKGGAVMIPIFGLSIIGLAIIIERIIVIRRKKGDLKAFMSKLKPRIEEGKISEASAICAAEKTCIARIASAILDNYGENREKLEIAADEAIITEIPKLERHIGFLGIIATVEPLLGLLGTVTGMIKAFFVISNISLSNPAQLANGIAEALYTTAAGLIVGIPAIAAYNYFMIRIESINWDMEQISTKLINYLCSKSEKQNSGEKK